MKLGSMQQLRGPERLFRIGQWAVALLFAYFLAHVGASIIADLPIISHKPKIEQFRDADAVRKLEKEIAPQKVALEQLDVQLKEKNKAQEKAQNNYDQAKESFETWRSARSSTEQSTENPQVVARAKSLDQLQAVQQGLANEVDALENKKAAIESTMAPNRKALADLEEKAVDRLQKAERSEMLKLFALRLCFVLPILLIAVWLFRKHRQGKQWPFVWGFVLFALFAFFFELVPYLPSFGGYIRYGVGAVMTFFGGRALIAALQKYLERKQQEQDAPQEERKQDIRYEKALDSIAHNQCPSCERGLPAVDGANVDFCMHCGLKLFSQCRHCGLRSNAFYHYCPACGVEAKDELVEKAIPSQSSLANV